MNKELPKAYNPKEYEDKIYEKWEKSGFFSPDKCVEDGITKKNADNFSIALPPPNRTGVLHIGHALMLVIQDILTRYHRMKGEKILWVPGTDHAAIATQSVVEKKLYNEEGKTRHDLGREKFLKQVYEFADKSHKRITEQVKKMGSSLDWSREAYTLDEARTRTVQTVFKMMYDDGLIYRGDRVVNWCPRCHSTLADDEVEYKTQKAKLYTFKYSKDFPFTIATTRPETKLGDTAVAVNPKDKRYKKYIGKIYDIDFVGVPLKLKIIADRAVDAEFGTGAVGVTPAHSMVDWQMAQEHNLEIVKVINEDGNIVDGFADYSSKTVEQAREMIVKKLKEQGLLEKEEEIENNLSLCYRCDTPIEPLPSLQWFIDVNKPLRGRPAFAKATVGKQQKLDIEGKTLKEIAIDVVKSGKIKIIPKRFEKNYFHWMDNLRDWCISRQIWFGHRVPVWYKSGCRMSDVGCRKVDITYFAHGSTEANEKDLVNDIDYELSDLGIKQSEKLSKLIAGKKFDIVITSDFKRAIQTAEIMFKERDVNIIKDKRLREVDLGSEETINDSKRISIPFSGGESYKDVEKRVFNFLSDLMDKYQGKRVAIITHRIPQLAIDVLLKGKTWEQATDEDWRKKKAWQPGWEYKLTGEEIYVGVEPPKGKGWVQDEDTLDTWFSSGLWTFSTLANSPDQIKIKDGKLVIDSDDFKNFHPTTVMETGYDILFFWVARMIIMTTYAVGDIPFKDVYLHGLVRDEKGRKMSKSLGNAIDPLDVCAKYGTDAVRLSLIIGTTPGNDLNLSEGKIAGYRNFTNKLWNISRYVIGNLKLEIGNLEKKDTECPIGHSVSETTLADKWILGKMGNLIKEVSEDLDNYRFSQAGERLRDFTWNDFADWYIEVSKFEKNSEKDKILIMILQDLLKLWHPFMPFVTEAIWSSFAKATEDKDKLLMIEKWPFFADKRGLASPKEAKPLSGNDFELIKNIIVAIRNARSQYRIKPSQKIKAVIYAGKNKKLIESQAELIKKLRTGIDELEIKSSYAKDSEDKEKITGIYLTVNNVEIYLIGVVDKEKENIRIKKEIENFKKIIAITEKKLSNKQFIKKAPEKIVKQEKEKLGLWREELKKLKGQLSV